MLYLAVTRTDIEESMKKAIARTQNDALQAYGLEVQLINPSVAALMTLPNGGIIMARGSASPRSTHAEPDDSALCI